MFRTSLPLLITLFALSLITIPIQAQPLTEFKVPERPEGIIEGPGSTVFVSQILSGKVLSIDVTTGETTEVIGEQSEEGRQAWGLWYHELDDQGYLWVAGGGPNFGNGQPQVYLYHVETGNSIVACSPPSVNETGHGVFINDVAVLDGTAYVTDSFSARIMAVDVLEAMEGNCNVTEIFLPNEFIPQHSEDWGTNGIVPLELGGFKGLLLSNEIDGTVFAMQLTEEGLPIYQKILGNSAALGADGLAVLDDQLYVTQNTQNRIAVYNMTADDNGAIYIDRMGFLTSPDYDTPATSALSNGYVYSTNSRFVQLPDIAAEADNNIIGVVNTFCCDGEGMDEVSMSHI